MTAIELHVIIQNSMAQAGCGYVSFGELSSEQREAMRIATARVNAHVLRELDKYVVGLYARAKKEGLVE